MKLKIMTALALAAFWVAPQASALAVLTDCDSTSTEPDAVACLGTYTGNNVGNPALTAEVLALLNTQWGGYFSSPITETGTTNADGGASGPFAAFDDDLNSGTLYFDTTQYGYFIVGLKYSTFFDFYLFNAPDGLASIDFSGLSNGLSHATLYNGGRTTVPEPTSLALLGLGLAGLGLARRRRS